MKETRFINIYGAPCSGKSTFAAQLYADMKQRGFDVELVREYAKELVYTGELKRDAFDAVRQQLGIFAKQRKRETVLIDKVDYVITDSPSLLSIFYMRYYFQDSLDNSKLLSEYISLQEQRVLEQRHKDLNFFLPIQNKYTTDGRVHTQVEAANISTLLHNYLTNLGVELRQRYTILEKPPQFDPKVLRYATQPIEIKLKTYTVEVPHN